MLIKRQEVWETRIELNSSIIVQQSNLIPITQLQNSMIESLILIQLICDYILPPFKGIVFIVNLYQQGIVRGVMDTDARNGYGDTSSNTKQY